MNRFLKYLWLFTLFIIIIIMGSLIITNSILIYLSPRMIPLVKVGVIILIILFVYEYAQTLNEKDDSPRHVKIFNLVFMIPISLFLLTTPNENTVKTLDNQTLNLSFEIIEEEPNQINETATPAPSTSEEADTPTESGVTSEPDASLSEEIVEPETSIDTNVSTDITLIEPCTVSDSQAKGMEFDQFNDCLYKGNDQLNGTEVTLLGFVYKDDSFPENTILVSRYMISCCVADATLGGFHVKVENIDDFEENEWIEVTGTAFISSFEYYGELVDFPVISAGSIVRCAPLDLDDSYIYW